MTPFIEARRAEGRKTKTINNALGIVRRILNLAASEWIDENGLTWLASANKIKLLSVYDAKVPYPLSWKEQQQLFDKLPEHLRLMATFKVNTGCREREVCGLKWEWETQIPELNTSVFVIPAYVMIHGRRQTIVKNGEDRLVVLNKIAKPVIEQVRHQHPELYVLNHELSIGIEN